MLYKYLGGKNIPGSRVLQYACLEWGVSLDYRGVALDADYFKGDNPGACRPKSYPKQMQFSFVRESFSSEYAQVDIRKRKHAASETLELRMTVRLDSKR